MQELRELRAPQGRLVPTARRGLQGPTARRGLPDLPDLPVNVVRRDRWGLLDLKALLLFG
jgi:hypothetical protein